MNPTDAKREQEATWSRVAPAWSTWDDLMVRSKSPVSLRMLELGGVAPGHQILDVASGTGEPAIDAATRVGPAGSVLGLDLSESMLTFAREKARKRGLENIVFRRVDGEELDVDAGTFDVVTCRFGLMFMPNPLACLVRCHTALRPSGGLVAACWEGPEQNPWASVPAAICRRRLGLSPPPADAPGIFALADPMRVRQLVERAGFRNVDIVEQAMAWGSFETVEHAATFVAECVGPVTAMLSGVPDAERTAIVEEIRDAFAPFRSEAGVALPGVASIVVGTA